MTQHNYGNEGSGRARGVEALQGQLDRATAESTSAALRRAEQERDEMARKCETALAESDLLNEWWMAERRERDLARAELASARQELDAVRTARDRLDADLGAARAGRFVDPAGPLAAVANERKMQDDKWGVRDHPDGTISLLRHYAAMAKRDCERAAQQRRLTWSHILAEEFWEAMTEDEPAKLRAELVQVAAVAVAWVEAIDRRSNLLDPPS